MNEISLINQSNEDIIELPILRKLIDYALKAEKVDKVIFSIVFINNDEMQRLNKQYRNIDKVTDVLSFAFEDNSDTIKMDIRMLGDIYISIDKAHEQACEYGHAYLRELSFLMIHGFLHLLGYDHDNEENESIMFNRQEVILDEFGIKR